MSPDDRFERLFSHSAPKKLPTFLERETLPALRDTRGHELDREVSDALLRTLIAKEKGLPALVSAKPHLDPGSTDALVAALLERWATVDHHGRFGWILEAAAHVGGDRCALRIAPLLERWPKASETGRKRATAALAILRRIGTDTALLVLLGMGQTEVLPSVALAATEELERAARERKVTVGELGDHVTPDCGLDARGRKVFEVGGRRFEVVFDEYFEPRVRDDEGGVGSELPEPESTDDPAGARRAAEEWAVMSGQLAAIARVQSRRLEDAMITERRWKLADWRTYLHGHPLMIHFTRRLVWGVFTGDDELRQTFRTAEDGTFVDLADEEVELPESGRLGIVHPLHLSDADRLAWSEHVADYEIIAPFAQLGRPLHRPTAEEAGDKTLTRFQKTSVPAAAVHDVLIELGFARDEAYLRKFFQKDYEDGRLRVRIYLEPGIHAGASEHEPPQTIPEIVFRHHSSALRIGQVSPVAFSEVVLAVHHVIDAP